MSVAELYEGSIKTLSAAERLRLATMILNELPAREIRPILTSLSPEEQIEALNALTSKTLDLPVLSDQAFDRDRLQEREP